MSSTGTARGRSNAGFKSAWPMAKVRGPAEPGACKDSWGHLLNSDKPALGWKGRE
jgi:hypothetical protein